MFEGKIINLLPMTPEEIVNNVKAKDKDNSEWCNNNTQKDFGTTHLETRYSLLAINSEFYTSSASFSDLVSRLACRRVRQPAWAIWLSIFLCGLRVNESRCNCFTLLLRVTLVVVAMVGGQPWWWHHDDGDHVGDGDHAGALEMEIKSTRRKAISYHNFWIACDVNPFMHLMFLLRFDRDGSIIRWSLSLISRRVLP